MAKRTKRVPPPWFCVTDDNGLDDGFRVQSGDTRLDVYTPVAEGIRTREDGRLMAASHELYAALKRIVTAWRSVPEDVQVPEEINVDEMWAEADKAIRKAEGPKASTVA